MDNLDVTKQYENYLDLFIHPGWKLFLEDIESMMDGLDSIEYVATLEELHNKKGQLSILKRISGFENAMKAAYEDFQENA
jgi:hypothetical protein